PLGAAPLDRGALQQLLEAAAPAGQDLVDGDEVVSRDRVHLGLPDRLGKQQLLTLGGCDLSRLAAHLGCELELAAALEGAEAAAEVELDAVVVAEAGFDVGAAQGVTAAGALTTPDLGPEHP